ncbi:MAG: hypothetical protein KZQ72_11165, partial [Candidatus Thiodiazotropha sp. (ex Cardiolucina cf. quadrata)]|nr:hypothetical protein [Candidatus Thiodiazotropha sp. (ex Cardiolucina cf. quadrata)]
MIKHFAIISFLSLIIGSCGGSGDNIKIDEFNITGTSDDRNGPRILDSLLSGFYSFNHAASCHTVSPK